GSAEVSCELRDSSALASDRRTCGRGIGRADVRNGRQAGEGRRQQDARRGRVRVDGGEPESLRVYRGTGNDDRALRAGTGGVQVRQSGRRSAEREEQYEVNVSAFGV